MSELLKQADEYLKCCDNLQLIEDTPVVCKKLIKALAEELRGKEWQDIATAPKGRTRFLVTNGVAVGLVHHKNGNYYVYDNARKGLDAATDWQPLPQPKQED